ncbi:MAG TPA: S41 family peptidase [Gemmatimonadales bacterium]
MPPAPPYDAAVGLRTFDRAWQIVHETHFDTTFNGVDWLALREELRPRAEQATSTAALRATIGEMVGRLRQSHFSLIPEELADTLAPVPDGGDGDAVTGDVGADTLAPVPDGGDGDAVTGDVGLDVRLLGDELVVTRVEPDSPADSAGIRPGWVLTATDDDSLAPVLRRVRKEQVRYPDGFLLWTVAERRMGGAVGSPVALAFLDGTDRPQRRTLARRAVPSEPIKFGNMPTFFARFARDEYTTPAGRRAGRIWFNFWMPPLIRQVDDAVEAFRAYDGIVVDLRGNRGGAGGMVMGVAGHFLTERVSLGDFRTRRSTLQFRANPRLVSPGGERVEPFGGPVAILIDETSGSASEVFAGGMQALGRVRVFGATSLGGVLPAVFDRLPNGDVLYHAIADFATPDGIVLEGRGVVPDEPVRPTRADLLAGRDPVLDAALAWIDTHHNH